MKSANSDTWPERPAVWPDVLTAVETALFLRLDALGHTPASAMRALRRLRRVHGLPIIGRTCGHLMFRTVDVETWRSSQTHPAISDQISISQTTPSNGHTNGRGSDAAFSIESGRRK